MSDIAVFLRFQKLWALMYALEYAGNSTCTGILASIASPFTVFIILPPPWDSNIMTALPSAIPLSCRNLAPLLSSCTILLMI